MIYDNVCTSYDFCTNKLHPRYLGTLHPANTSATEGTMNSTSGVEAGGYQMKLVDAGSLDYNFGTKHMSYYLVWQLQIF